MGTAVGVFNGDAPRRRPASEPIGEHRRRGLALVEPECRAPLALVGADIVGRGGIDDLVGADEEQFSGGIDRRQRGPPPTVVPTVSGEVLDMLR